MQIKDKVFKRKSGKSKNKWIVRLEYFDDVLGKTRFIERQAEKKCDASDLRNKLLDDIKKSHGQMQTGERMTFTQLADLCEKTFYKPAVIIEGRKVAGIRSSRSVKTQVNVLRKFFGKRLIKEITTESLIDYKLWRLNSKTERGGYPIKIATANRELAAMRKIMRFAYSKGWILRDIFFNAKIIDASNEIERTRLLSYEEEARLLNSCQGERQITYKRKLRGKEQEVTATVSVDNPHLKGMIILAIDSGMRLGEILKLQWVDIDFQNNLIRVIGTNTKTERERLAPLSRRVKDELEKIREITSGDRPFPFTDIKRSFATAKRVAKIDDLHFHDLRRTAITRWIQQGIPLALSGKLAGHSQLQTTMKHYTSTDVEMVREIAEKINAFYTQNEDALTSKLVN
jgi:integrase